MALRAARQNFGSDDVSFIRAAGLGIEPWEGVGKREFPVEEGRAKPVGKPWVSEEFDSGCRNSTSLLILLPVPYQDALKGLRNAVHGLWEGLFRNIPNPGRCGQGNVVS